MVANTATTEVLSFLLERLGVGNVKNTCTVYYLKFNYVNVTMSVSFIKIH